MMAKVLSVTLVAIKRRNLGTWKTIKNLGMGEEYTAVKSVILRQRLKANGIDMY